MKRQRSIAGIVLSDTALALPALIIVGIVALPFFWLAALSFVSDGSLSLVHYQRMLENPSYARIMSDTLYLSFLV
ncbi:MAG: hypothetical protein AB7F76_02545, partial [Parvibaculaceae bacterium]